MSDAAGHAVGYGQVRAPRDELVCITIYKKGAAEVVRRLAA